MASKFLVWVTNGTTVMDKSTFEALNDRKVGFQGGQKAIARNVNAGLRQANLVVAALMETILPTSNLDLQSSLDDVVNAMKTTHPFNIPMTLISTNCFGYSDNGTETGASKSLLIGFNNVVSKAGVGMFGQQNRSNSDYALICGKYNRPQANSLFEVGLGSGSNDRQNAFQITFSGATAYSTFKGITTAETLRATLEPMSTQDVVRLQELNPVKSNVTTLQGQMSTANTNISNLTSRLNTLGFSTGTLGSLGSGVSGYIYKSGRVVQGSVSKPSSASINLSNGQTLCTIPEGYRPYTTYTSIIGVQYVKSSSTNEGWIEVECTTDGNVKVKSNGKTLVTMFTFLFGWFTVDPNTLK